MLPTLHRCSTRKRKGDAVRAGNRGCYGWCCCLHMLKSNGQQPQKLYYGAWVLLPWNTSTKYLGSAQTKWAESIRIWKIEFGGKLSSIVLPWSWVPPTLLFPITSRKKTIIILYLVLSHASLPCNHPVGIWNALLVSHMIIAVAQEPEDPHAPQDTRRWLG